MLARRGYSDPAAARVFLAAEPPGHDPLLLGDMAAAVERIKAAIAAGERICVHGDYDVDGICAAAVAVLSLREAGADVIWHLPSRFEEGYGIALETVERLATDGVGLLLTVDCGITAVAEVARAKELGVDVIVTDHHRPGDTLPDCLVVATRPSRYPFPELCGTGVAHKLAEALARCRAPGAGSPARPRRRSPRSPTSCRCRTRTALSPQRASVSSPAPAVRVCAPSCSPREWIRRPSMPRRSPSGSRRGSTPPDGCTARTSRSTCCSRRTPRRPGAWPGSSRA